MTADDVAAWMQQEITKEKYLYQDTTVYDIHSKFGETFVYYNDNGNLVIAKNVLLSFRKLTAKAVVWERGEKMWRLRESCDSPERGQY